MTDDLSPIVSCYPDSANTDRPTPPAAASARRRAADVAPAGGGAVALLPTALGGAE